MNIYVIAEIEGGHLVQAFTNEQDAKSYLQWEEAIGRMHPNSYTVKEITLRNY